MTANRKHNRQSQKGQSQTASSRDLFTNKRRGQVSIEMIAVFSVLLLLFLIALFASFNLYQQRKAETDISQALVSAQRLADNVNFLCRLPEDSKTTVRVHIPEPVLTDQRKISGENNRTIQLQIRTTDINRTIHATTDCRVTGTLPPNTGEFNFQMKRRKNDVLVNWTVIG